MNETYVKNVIEAAMLAAGRPLAVDELVGVFDQRDGSNAEEVRAALDSLRADYESRGLELVEVASGFRIQIRAAVAEPVSRLWMERPAKYSRALLERSWVRVVGHRDVPGKPELLGTTREFLDYFGLKKLDELPTLSQLREMEDLRIQLTLPGAEPVAAASDAAAVQDAPAEGTEAQAASDEDAAPDEEPAPDEDADERGEAGQDPGAPRAQGLVARSTQDL